MRIEYQLSENGTHTGFRSANLERAQEPTTTTTTYHLADSTPWGDLSLIIGLPHSRVMRALAIGLAQIAADEELKGREEAWRATLAKPAYVEKLIAEGDWMALVDLTAKLKLPPEYQQQLADKWPEHFLAPGEVNVWPPHATMNPLPEIQATPANTNPASAMRTAWDAMNENPASVTVQLSGATQTVTLPEPAPAVAKAKAAPTATKKSSAKSGGATASGRSKRSSAASRSKSSSRPSSRAKSIAG